MIVQIVMEARAVDGWSNFRFTEQVPYLCDILSHKVDGTWYGVVTHRLIIVATQYSVPTMLTNSKLCPHQAST